MQRRVDSHIGYRMGAAGMVAAGNFLEFSLKWSKREKHKSVFNDERKGVCGSLLAGN